MQYLKNECLLVFFALLNLILIKFFKLFEKKNVFLYFVNYQYIDMTNRLAQSIELISQKENKKRK